MRLLFSLFFLFSITGFCQTKKATIGDLKFMEGKWTVAHKWGDMEEIWSGPMGDNMMCTYRCVKNDKIVFYEFIVIEQSDSVPVMKLRHFNPGSIAWEDKQSPYDYPLVKLEGNKAIFERPDKKTRLVYERRSANELVSVLERVDKNGQWQRDEFNYTKVN